MTSKTTHYHHKVVGFWGLRPQAPTGGSTLDSTGGLPFPRPPEFLLPSGKSSSYATAWDAGLIRVSKPQRVKNPYVRPK